MQLAEGCILSALQVALLYNLCVQVSLRLVSKVQKQMSVLLVR